MTENAPQPNREYCRIRIGLTELLPEFLDVCSCADSGTFFLAAPFVDETLIAEVSARFTRQQIRFHIVVPNEDVSAKLRNRLHPRSLAFVTIYLCRHLHAKVYLFETATRELIGLIGSQNLTRAGTTTNIEVGVLLHARSGTAEWLMLADLRATLYERSRLHSRVAGNNLGGDQDVTNCTHNQ
jgi:phosphatidylserine/phosphatidylglycerophosphate/cardiolipin synthase-like enzyme